MSCAQQTYSLQHLYARLSLQAFEQIDVDKSGTISVDELSVALKQFKVFDDAQALLATADKNNVSLRA